MLHFFIFKSILERATLTFIRMIFLYWWCVGHSSQISYVYFVLYEIFYFTILLIVNVPLRLFLFVYKIWKIANKGRECFEQCVCSIWYFVLTFWYELDIHKLKKSSNFCSVVKSISTCIIKRKTMEVLYIFSQTTGL